MIHQANITSKYHRLKTHFSDSIVLMKCAEGKNYNINLSFMRFSCKYL